ncbi:PEP-CTERM sorting domain-containing protein [Rhodopirellula bahusiensis]|uniref:PEP-CTERM sorting domain-containing protein n=1 Tax=Rhodopirellula bahusiensis TaxID=2014065 RepID=UPI00130424A0
MIMKMVDLMGNRNVDMMRGGFSAVIFIAGIIASSAGLDAGIVTRTVTFNDVGYFDVAGSDVENGLSSYTIDGMKFSISEGVFLYAQNGNNSFYWSGQNDTNSTSLGSEAGAKTFTLELDDPNLGPTFDMRSITLIGFSTSSSADQTTFVTFTGSKVDSNEDVTYETVSFDASTRSGLTIDFDAIGVDFSNLTSLSWSQGPTARAHQFDNVTFSASAVPEPGSLVAMLAVALVGMGTRLRSWFRALYRLS